MGGQGAVSSNLAFVILILKATFFAGLFVMIVLGNKQFRRTTRYFNVTVLCGKCSSRIWIATMQRGTQILDEGDQDGTCSVLQG